MRQRFKLEVPFGFPYTERMKNKNNKFTDLNDSDIIIVAEMWRDGDDIEMTKKEFIVDYLCDDISDLRRYCEENNVELYSENEVLELA